MHTDNIINIDDIHRSLTLQIRNTGDAMNTDDITTLIDGIAQTHTSHTQTSYKQTNDQTLLATVHSAPTEHWPAFTINSAGHFTVDVRLDTGHPKIHQTLTTATTVLVVLSGSSPGT